MTDYQSGDLAPTIAAERAGEAMLPRTPINESASSSPPA